MPAIARADFLNEIAMVALDYSCTGACDESSPPTAALVFPGGSTDGGSPTLSPDGTRLAFQREGEILAIDVRDLSVRNLTNHAANDFTPAWSRTGKIAFYSDRDGSPELYVMNSDGSGVVRVTYGVGFTGGPDWSPDGVKIAFNCEVVSGNPDVCVINADGTGCRRLTTDPGWDGSAAWSPDGKKVAFGTMRYSDDLAGYWPVVAQLAVMNPDGGGVSSIGVSGFDPSWSPDGTRLGFVQVEPCYSFWGCPHVSLVRLDGSGYEAGIPGSDPAWRPASGAVATLSPSSVTFGTQLVGVGGNAQTVTLANTGTADPTISGIGASGDFAQSSTCGSRVAPGASCSISVTFTPTATGARSGSVTISGNASGSPHVVSLAGTGNLPPVALFTSSCSALGCVFNGAGSSDPGGTVTGHAWAFGDGTSGSGVQVGHVYATAGTYAVTLTVTDNFGATGVQSAKVTAGAVSPPTASLHVADLDGSRTSLGAKVTVLLHDSGHSPVSEAALSGTWSTGGMGACMTNRAGQCTMSVYGVPKTTPSVTFTVAAVSHQTLGHEAAANHDAEGDSNGTSITVSR